MRKILNDHRGAAVPCSISGLVVSVIFLAPCWAFLIGYCLSYDIRFTLSSFPLRWKVLAAFGAMFAIIAVLSFLIWLPTMIGMLLSSASKAGLGLTEFWIGSSLSEKLCRELTRIGIVGVAILLTTITIGLLPDDCPIWLKTLGFLASVQVYSMGLVSVVVAPLKSVWPKMGGFAGSSCRA